jgi:gas vesicle protein
MVYNVAAKQWRWVHAFTVQNVILSLGIFSKVSYNIYRCIFLYIIIRRCFYVLLKDLIEKRRKERKRAARRKTVKNTAIGAGVGAAVGLAAGVLLAPKSGKETREDIVDNTKRAAGFVSDNTKKAVDKVSEASRKAVDTVKGSIHDVKEKIAEFRASKEESIEEVAVTEEVKVETEDKEKGKRKK